MATVQEIEGVYNFQGTIEPRFAKSMKSAVGVYGFPAIGKSLQDTACLS